MNIMNETAAIEALRRIATYGPDGAVVVDGLRFWNNREDYLEVERAYGLELYDFQPGRDVLLSTKRVSGDVSLS